MSYQSNGIVSNGLPSLYDEGAAADTTDKSLSILSAVTGKDVSKSAGQHKKSIPPRTLFLYILFIGSMLGFTYWQYNSYEIGTGLATFIAPNPVTKNPQQPTLAATLPAIARTPAPQAKIDAALIETVSEKPTLSAPHNSLQPDVKTPDTSKKSTAAGPVKNPAQPLASPTPSPTIAKKTEVKKIAPAKEAKMGAPPVQLAQTAQTIRPAKPTQPKPTTQAAKHAQPAQRSKVAVAQADPDEKLLEGILRLMKREPAKDAAQVRSAK